MKLPDRRVPGGSVTVQWVIPHALRGDGLSVYRRLRRRITWPALLAALVGCGVQEDTPGLPSWSIRPEPVTSVGMVEGDSAYLFQQVVAAGLLSDGRIMVADGGLSVVRVFDASGAFLVQMGGPGDGPGEFAALRDARVTAGDTIVAWDSQAARVSRFTASGELVRTVVVNPPANSGDLGGLDALAGVFSDGSLVLTRLTFGGASSGQGVPDRLAVERYGSEGEFLGRGRERGGLVRVATSAGSAPLPFTPFPYFADAGDVLYFTDGSPPVVSVMDRSLADVRRIELPSAVHDPEGAWRDLAARLNEPDAPPMAAWFGDLMAETSPPDSIPHIAGLLVDDQERLWTKQYDPAEDALWLRFGGRVAGGVWWVSDVSTGLVVARARIPERLSPVEVKEDRLLGVSVDDFGVQRVVLVEVVRPKGGQR
jgi:hypothetical protein